MKTKEITLEATLSTRTVYRWIDPGPKPFELARPTRDPDGKLPWACFRPKA